MSGMSGRENVPGHVVGNQDYDDPDEDDADDEFSLIHVFARCPTGYAGSPHNL